MQASKMRHKKPAGPIMLFYFETEHYAGTGAHGQRLVATAA